MDAHGDNQQATRELSWLAGFVDGEGCLSFYHIRRGHRDFIVPAVHIGNTHFPTIDRVCGILQHHGIGHHVQDRTYDSRWNPTRMVRVLGAKRVLRFLDRVEPLLFTKRPQAALLRRFIEYRLTQPITQPYNGIEWELAKQMTVLNSRKPPETVRARPVNPKVRVKSQSLP